MNIFYFEQLKKINRIYSPKKEYVILESVNQERFFLGSQSFDYGDRFVFPEDEYLLFIMSDIHVVKIGVVKKGEMAS